jgi:drug/metabolite transporter (DMT)-like permease
MCDSRGSGQRWQYSRVPGLGIDNNLTRKVSLTDATWIASIKGLTAGSVNLTLAIGLGAHTPRIPDVASAMILGLFAYGVSLALFVVALRHLGTARTGAYFSVRPSWVRRSRYYSAMPLHRNC